MHGSRLPQGPAHAIAALEEQRRQPGAKQLTLSLTLPSLDTPATAAWHAAQAMRSLLTGGVARVCDDDHLGRRRPRQLPRKPVQVGVAAARVGKSRGGRMNRVGGGDPVLTKSCSLAQAWQLIQPGPPNLAG